MNSKLAVAPLCQALLCLSAILLISFLLVGQVWGKGDGFTEISCHAEGEDDTYLYCVSDYKCDDPRLYHIISVSFEDWYIRDFPICSKSRTEIRLKKKDIPKPCPWRFRHFDLCEEWCDKKNEKEAKEHREYIERTRRDNPDHIIFSLPFYYADCPPDIKTENLNKLLGEGWELQELYRGDRIIYLKKRVCE